METKGLPNDDDLQDVEHVLGGVVAMVGFVGTTSPAAAASQVGGVPSVSDRVAALEQIAGTLQSQVSALQGQITTPQSANSTLQSALDAEIANRKLGDDALQTALDNEINARKTQDDALKSLITSSSSKAFSSFKGVSDLVQGAEATVGSLGPLPAGSYAVSAQATVSNLNHDAFWDCTLVTDGGIQIGRSSIGTESASTTTTGASDANAAILP
jgi:hypothetical protein